MIRIRESDLPEVTTKTSYGNEYLVVGEWTFAEDEETAEDALASALAHLALHKYLQEKTSDD